MKKEYFYPWFNLICINLAKLGVPIYPKPHLSSFKDLLNSKLKNIKVIVLNYQPLLRPDSTGLSCFYNSDLKIKDNLEIKNLKYLLGENYNEHKDHYINEDILFLNCSLTISPDFNNSIKYWEDITSKILKFCTKENHPIIISVGGNDSYNFAYNNSHRPLLIREYEDRNIPIEHLPLDHTYILDFDITQHHLNFVKDVDKIKPKELINLLLNHRKLKKIDWL